MSVCPICYENCPSYKMNACSHSICFECSVRMKELTSDEHKPFGEYIELSIRLPRISCPMCRSKECLSPETRKRLNRQFPNAYKIWFQTELFRDDDGTMYYISLRKSNVQLIPNDQDDLYSLMDRMELTCRTRSCYVDDVNLYTHSAYFLQWLPVQHTYPNQQYTPKLKQLRYQ
jgi:hypothetical protein